MIKNNKGKLLITSVVILLPALIGVLFWDSLPDLMAVHWGADGTADGWQGKALAVFGLPLILLALHWFCVLITTKDTKNQGQNKKAISMVLWILPVLSLFTSGVVYATALGLSMNVTRLMPILLGVLFLVIGNYLPKCKQNYTLGIKIHWTLQDEETWNRTHRLAGKLWVCGGVLILFTAFLPGLFTPLYGVLTLLIPMVLIPLFYAYAVYRKRREAGLLSPATPLSKPQKTARYISLVLVVVILLGVAVLMFSGNVTVEYDDTAFTVDATYWSPLTVEYDAIDAIEYRQNNNPGGTRTYGFASSKLLLGNFEDETCGNYTRYTYTDCKATVSIVVNGKGLVINGIDEAATKAIYDTLMEKTRN